MSVTSYSSSRKRKAFLHSSTGWVYIQQGKASYIFSMHFFSLHSAVGYEDPCPVACVICHHLYAQAMVES